MNKGEIRKSFRVKKIVRESINIQSYYFEGALQAKPGQFVMVWMPGADEKPFSLSKIGKDFAVTVMCLGSFTRKLCEFMENEFLGVRGPYGNGYDLEGVKKAVIVSGGCGVASLKPLAEELHRKKAKVKFILGAKTEKELAFDKELEKSCDLYITTDDGSKGEKGFATAPLEKMLGKEKFDCVYACGPELMLGKVAEICKQKRVRCQLSLERYMKCGGLGVCGSCSINGLSVCKDGPIFTGEQISKLSEFGKFARIKSGKKVTLEEYRSGRTE